MMLVGLVYNFDLTISWISNLSSEFDPPSLSWAVGLEKTRMFSIHQYQLFDIIHIYFTKRVENKNQPKGLKRKAPSPNRMTPESGKFYTHFFSFWGWRWIPKNLTVDLDLCCCRARIRVACWLRKPPAEPDIWGAWRDEAYNEKRMLFITLLAPWPKHNGCQFNLDLVENIESMGFGFKPL